MAIAWLSINGEPAIGKTFFVPDTMDLDCPHCWFLAADRGLLWEQATELHSTYGLLHFAGAGWTLLIDQLQSIH